jgi:hypothetical protein
MELLGQVNGKIEILSQAVGKQEAVEYPNNTKVIITRASKRQRKSLVTKKENLFLVNNLKRLTRFHMMTSFDNTNYKISIPIVN